MIDRVPCYRIKCGFRAMCLWSQKIHRINRESPGDVVGWRTMSDRNVYVIAVCAKLGLIGSHIRGLLYSNMIMLVLRGSGTDIISFFVECELTKRM